MKKINVAVVGCGNISGIYLSNLTTRWEHIHIYAVADLNRELADKAAMQYHIPNVMTLDEILKDDKVDIVLNLTAPHGHFEISKRVLESNKHVYLEKPLSLTYSQGKELIEYADSHGLYIGCAPDTFMGAGISTCKELIRRGMIGEVIGATAFMVCHGHESWHPNPEFYYQKGGGPMFDMGPYYLTALTEMMGNACCVSGMTVTGQKERTITSAPKNGKVMQVEVPTHVNGLIRFESGAVANIITSFDVWGSTLPCLEIHGTLGSIQCPDPNGFGGTVKYKRADAPFEEVPYVNEYSENCRGIGLADLAQAILSGRQTFAASGHRALHVLEIMEKIHTADQNQTVEAIHTGF